MDKLDHWLSGETIRAKSEGDLRRLLRWMRKHPWAGRLAAAMLIIAVVVPISSLTAYFRTVGALRQTTIEKDAIENHCRELSQSVSRNAAELKAREASSQSQLNKQREAEHQFQQLKSDFDRNQQLCKAADQRLHKAVRDARLSLAEQFSHRAEKLQESMPESGFVLATEALNITQQEGAPPNPAALKQVRDLLAPTDELVLSGHDDPVAVLAASRDGNWLASGDAHGMVRLWATDSATPVDDPRLLHGQWDRITQLLFTSDSRWLVSGSAGSTICLWDLKAADPIAKRFFLQGKPGRVVSITVSEDGRWVAAASTGVNSKDNCVRLWDLRAKEIIANPVRLPSDQGEICALAISPDGDWIASGDSDGAARLWRANDPSPNVVATVRHVRDAPVRTIGFSPDGHWLIAAAGSDGGKNRTILAWGLSSKGAAAEPVVLTDDSGRVELVAITADGKWLIVANEEPTLQVWDLSAVDQGKPGTLLTGQTSSVQAITPSANGRWLATSGADGTVCLWTIGAAGPAGPPVTIHPTDGELTGVAFAAKGDWIATGNDQGAIQLWNLRVDDLIRMANSKLLP